MANDPINTNNEQRPHISNKLTLKWPQVSLYLNTTFLLSVGPTFGGFMYEFAGKEAPFIILASLALLDGRMYIDLY